MSSCDKELQDAGIWLIESQAVVEYVICRTFEYRELKMDSDDQSLMFQSHPKNRNK